MNENWTPMWFLSSHVQPLPKKLRKLKLKNPIVRIFVFSQYSVGREYHAKNGMWINPLTGKCSTHEILAPHWERSSFIMKVGKWLITRP